MSDYVYAMELKTIVSKDVSMRASLITSSDDATSASLKSHFAVNVEAKSNADTDLLEMYAREVDLIITKHWNDTLSDVVHGMDVSSSSKQLSICHSHPLRFGACIAASYHMLASEEMSKNGRAARRFLTDTDRANAATARLSLIRATEALRTISPGSSKLRRIRVSSTIFTPMSEYLRDVEELRRKRSSLARCELLSGDNPKPCANLAFEVKNLEGNVSSSSQWTSWVSRRNTEVDAEVAGIIAGGTEKTFVLHARSLHLHTFSQAVFVAYLDDIHASFAELFARHITGHYRYPQNDIELEDGGCMNPTVVERLYPTRCSKYPPPTSSNDAKIDWNGWDDVAGLLDLARALQREGLNMLGIRDPLTSVSDQTKIVKSSFSTSVIVASSSRTDEGGVQSHEVTTIVDELNQRYQMNGITSDLRDGGAFHHSLMLSEDTSDRNLQLHAVTSTGIPRYELTRSYAASTNPLLWANLSLEGDVNDPQKKSAAAWGCHIAREPGVDFSSDLWKANRENDMDRFARTALRAASRDFLNQSMADCGPEEGSASRRSLLHAPSLTHQLARAHIRKPLLMILRGVLGFAFLFVARVFAYGNRGPSRLTRISHARVLAVVLITVTAYFSCVTAQDSSCERSKASKLFQLAAKEINLGVEFNCSGIEDYPIGFTVPSFEVGDLSIAESSFEGSISLSPGSKLDFSEASYDISASAVNTFAVTYTDLFRLEISGVAVSATKKSAQDDVSWTFDGTIGELGLNIDAKASQIKSVVIDGDINDDSSEEYTRDVLTLFSSVFGDGLELNKIFVELNNDANKWDVFVKLGVSLWGADASLVANITDGEFRSIDAAITLSDNAFVNLRGVPPCSKTEGESLNGIISYNPGTESSDLLELTATVEAQCDSANKVTKLTVKASMNGPFQLDMGPLLALNVKEEDTVALIYSREYAKDEYAYLFLNVVAYPMNVTASLAESNSFIIKIGDRSSANAVDWDNAMVSIGDSEGTLRSILPSAFIGENALALHYFELRLETPDDQVEYDLACLFKVGGITVNGTVQAVGASQRLEVNRFTLSVVSDDAELRMTSEGEGVVKASFQMKEEIGIGFFHILPFSLHGSIIFSDNGHYDLSIAQRDDEKVTIRFFDQDVEFSFVEAAYSSLDGTLSFSGLVQDLFTVRYDKVGLSILDAPENDAKKNRKAFWKRTTNLIARNMFDLSAQNLNGKSLDKLNILGKILRDTFSVPDDIGINYLSIQSNDESNEGVTKVSFEYIRYEFRTAFNVSYNNGTLVDIDAVLSSGPLYIQVKGTSLCGEDGTGGTLDGEVELKEGGLAILPTGFRIPISISFQCTDGQYVGMNFLAELDDVTINLDAVDVRIDRLKVQYDTSSRNLMFSGIFGDGKVEVQFEYCPHDVASSTNKTNALANSKSKSKSSSKSDMSMSLSVIIAEDIEFSSLHDKLLSADAKDAAVGPMSTSSSCGDVGSEVLSSKIKKGSFLQMELNDAGVSFALVGNIQLFGADLRLVLLAENLGSKKSSRFLASVQISADASNLPGVIASAAEKAGGSLDVMLAIANKEGTYHVPAIDDDDSNEHSTRRLLAEGKTGESGGETIEMEGIFMLKISPGEEDPYAGIKDSNGPLADGEFGTAFFITVSSFSPPEFSIFVSVEIDLAIGNFTDPCATTATLRNVRGGIAVTPRSLSFFIASTFDIVIPRCSKQKGVKQPIPGETPDLVEVYGALGIKLPTFELVGKLALDAGDDGWQNPLNAGEKITLYRVEIELGIIFNPPTISCITIYAVAQIGELDGTIYLGLNLLPFPTVAFTLALENIGLGAALEPAFSAMGVDGIGNDPVLNEISFFSASFFRTWANTRLDDLVINGDLTIPPGFGVVAKDASLLYGLIEAEELSLIVAKAGHGAMIEAFANVKPINIMNIFQVKGRNADNPYLYMKVQVSTKAINLVYCSSGEIVFMGIKLGVTMNINSGNLDADCRQILEDRNVQIPERPSNVIDATGGIYIDASLTWGELYVNAFFMASTLKLWEKDAKLQFAFSIDTENDSSILTVIIRQMADALFGSLESAIDDMSEFAYRAIERAIDRVDEAQRDVEDARRDVNAGIDNAQRKVNNLQRSINDSRNKAHYHCDRCGFWRPGSCLKCPWFWAEVGVLEGLRAVAIGVLEIARAAVNSVLSVVQGTLAIAKNALKLVRNALELLVETLKSCLDYVADLIKKGADALDAIIQIQKFNVGASLGDGKISAELSVTLNLFNSGSKAFSFEIDSLDLKNLCTSIMNGMTDAVQTFLVGFLPKSVRDAFNLRRRRRLQQLPPPSMVNVNCTDPVIVASCYPRCCNSAVGADVEANEEAYEMLRSGHFNLTAETTDEEIEAQSGAIFFAARAVLMENVGALPPYKASDRMRPQPKAKVVMSYTTTATEWADRGDLREKMISSLQSTVDRSIKGHESEALSPKAAFACSPKCYATTSDVLWQVEAGPFYFHDMPSMVEHLVTDQAETRLQIEMHGVDGLRSPKFVGLSAGSADSVFEHLPAARNFVDSKDISDAALGTDNDLGTCAESSTSFFNNPIQNTSTVLDVTVKKAWHESPGAIALISTVCATTVLLIAVPVRLLVKKRELSRFLGR